MTALYRLLMVVEDAMQKAYENVVTEGRDMVGTRLMTSTTARACRAPLPILQRANPR
jgi:hypothetical protein